MGRRALTQPEGTERGSAGISRLKAYREGKWLDLTPVLVSFRRGRGEEIGKLAFTVKL